MSVSSLFDQSEYINNLLNDLKIEKSLRFEPGELAIDIPSDKFYMICDQLIYNINKHHNSTNMVVGSSSASNRSIYSIDQIFSSSVMALQPPSFETCSDNLQFRITHYLVTLLQAARISSHRCGGSNRRAAAAERGSILFQLDKICKNLDYVFPDDGSHEIDVIHSIKETVVNVQQLYPQIQADLFPVILRRIPLTATQEEIFNSLNRSISEDFHIRRRMIMKRLDVTIQSFLWGEKAIGKEGEIVAAIQAQRQHLRDSPTQYSLEDLWAAPISLLYESSKRVTNTVGKKSLVKNIIIGSVPDRGGRANEMRPKASDIGFNRDNGSGHKGNRNDHAVSRDKGTSGKQSHQQDKKPADAMDVDDLAPVNSSNDVAVTKDNRNPSKKARHRDEGRNGGQQYSGRKDK